MNTCRLTRQGEDTELSPTFKIIHLLQPERWRKTEDCSREQNDELEPYGKHYKWKTKGMKTKNSMDKSNYTQNTINIQR